MSGFFAQFDPTTQGGMQLAGLSGGLLGLGQGLVNAGASRPVGQAGPSVADAFGQFGAGQQAGLLNAYRNNKAANEQKFQNLWSELAGPQKAGPDGQPVPRSPGAQALYDAIPANKRGALFALPPEQGQQILGTLMAQNVKPKDNIQVVGNNMYDVSGAAPRFLGRSEEIKTPDELKQAMDLRAAGSPRLTVDARAMGTGLNTAYENAAKGWNSQLTEVGKVNKRETLLSNAEAALEGFTPGIGADLRLKGQQALSYLGLPSTAPAGELLQSVQRQLELANTPKGEGAITENERGLIREANNIMGSTPEGARTLIAATRELDKRERDVLAIYHESAKKNGGAPNPLEVSDAISKLPPALSVTTQAQINRMMRQAQGQPSGAQPPDRRTEAPRKITTKADFDALPSGATFEGTDGKVYKKP